MNIKFYKLSRVVKILPLKVLRYISGQNIIYPFYHSISDKDIIHIKHLYPLRSVKEFEKDLDFFLKYYEPVEINDLLTSIRNHSQLKGNKFLLSFDDGLVEFHDIAAPILLKKGIPATCFLNSGFIDNKDLFFRYKASILIEKLMHHKFRPQMQSIIVDWFEKKQLSLTSNFRSLLSINYNNRTLLDELAQLIEVDFSEYLKEQKPYMSTNQVKSLIAKGFSFGAHSIDHPQYSDIDINEQLMQTKESIKLVSSLFNLPYNIFSFPFTDFRVSKFFFDTIFQETNEIANITFACAGIKKDSCVKNIQRIPMEIDTFSAKDIVTGEYLYFLFKAILHKNTIKRN